MEHKPPLPRSRWSINPLPSEVDRVSAPLFRNRWDLNLLPPEVDGTSTPSLQK